MAKYDLTNSLEVSFIFSIGGKEFTFRKPTVREMRALAKQFSGISVDDDADKQIKASDEAMKTLYGFITPIDHDTDIAELMENQPVGVQTAFNEMVKTELGA